MFIFLLQVRNMLGGYPELYLFAVYSLLIWGLWLTKLLISQRYRPFTEPHTARTSVIIPVVDEPLDLDLLLGDAAAGLLLGELDEVRLEVDEAEDDQRQAERGQQHHADAPG